MEEQWAEIKDFEDYQISSFGRVKSFKQNKTEGKIISFGSSTVYLTVILRKDNKPYNKYVHRLVAEAFIPNPDNLPQVNHKDENTHNNNVENLEWVDQKTNNNYGTHNQRVSEKRKTMEIPHFRKVRCIETGEVFPSLSEAGRTMGVRDTSIRKACVGTHKTCKGFHWEFVEDN